MTEEELRTKKLQLEIDELSRSSWKKPAYLTIIISAVTVAISAYFGFSQYFKQVDRTNIETIERLEKEKEDFKNEKHDAQIAKAQYELLLRDVENKEMQDHMLLISQQSLEQEKQFASIKKKLLRVKNLEKTIDKYNSYIIEYARGVIASPSGQNKVREIIEIENPEQQKRELENFAFNITKQSHSRGLEQVLEEINKVGR